MAPLILVGVWADSFFLAIRAGGRALVGGLGGLNVNSTRGVLAYSSFVHRGWLMVAVVESSYVFIIYLVVYIVQLGVVTVSCLILNRRTYYRGSGRLLGRLGIISLRGMPPFGGFVPKLLLLLVADFKGVLVLPLMGRVIAIKYYTRISCALLLECEIT